MMDAMPEAKPCASCGQKPEMHSETPEGRLKPVWRMVCMCGQGPLQWSVTPEAAVRLWNSIAGQQKDNIPPKTNQEYDKKDNLD